MTYIPTACYHPSMEILTVYALAAGCVLISLGVTRALVCIQPWSNAINAFVVKHLAYPYFLGRHSFLGPWSRAGVLVHLGYATLNLFLIFFRAPSLGIAGNRAGTLSLINAVFLIASLHLSSLADLLGVSLKICRRVHRAAGWAALALISFHIAAMLRIHGSENLGKNPRALFVTIVSQQF